MTQKTPKAQKTKAKFYTPQNTLRLKTGYGGIDPVVMERAEMLIQKNDVDFSGMAKDILARLDKAVEAVKREDQRSKEGINRLVAPIMELKANGAMFKFPLLSDVAGIALDFLENIDHLNDDAFEIVNIHSQTLRIIVAQDLRGTGGKQGHILVNELIAACQRYNKKYNDNKE